MSKTTDQIEKSLSEFQNEFEQLCKKYQVHGFCYGATNENEDPELGKFHAGFTMASTDNLSDLPVKQVIAILHTFRKHDRIEEMQKYAVHEGLKEMGKHDCDNHEKKKDKKGKIDEAIENFVKTILEKLDD